jgi:maleylacetoacetate isomerase
MSSSPILYTYFRSSAAYRVRIALGLKGLDYEAIPVHLVKDGGEQRQPAYRAVNPFGLVPSYIEAGQTVHQSIAIMEYLEERHPQHALLPGDARLRAQVRDVSLAMACDIHPLNNLRVLQYLTQELGQTEVAKEKWVHHWTRLGLEALEQTLASNSSGKFCFGDSPSMADCCLVPQIFHARRFNVDVSAYPRLLDVDAACSELPAFKSAHPQNQLDAG